MNLGKTKNADIFIDFNCSTEDFNQKYAIICFSLITQN